MKSISTLPEGYTQIYTVDLQKDRKMAVFVNLLAVVITVAMVVPMHFCIPITTILDAQDGMGTLWGRCGILLLLLVVYMVLHELVHGIAMGMCGTKKVRYGFTGMYGFAASDDYYGKASYIFIALAPVVLWGIVLAAVNAIVPRSWFWVIYMIQVSNVSGAAGDFFVTVKFSRLPKEILVRDHGVGMQVYAKCK